MFHRVTTAAALSHDGVGRTRNGLYNATVNALDLLNVLTGFIRKAIQPFRKEHAEYASFELLCEMYERVWEADPSRCARQSILKAS